MKFRRSFVPTFAHRSFTANGKDRRTPLVHQVSCAEPASWLDVSRDNGAHNDPESELKILTTESDTKLVLQGSLER